MSSSVSLIVRSRQFALFLSLWILVFVTGCGGENPDGGGETDSTAALTQDSIGVEGDGGEEVVEIDTGSVVDDVEGKYQFKLTPKVGEVYKYQLVSRGNREMAEISQSKNETYDLTMSVVTVNDDGSLLLGVTYDRIRASISVSAPQVDSTGKPVVDSAGKPKIGKEKVTFDSKGGQNVKGGERYRAFIGKQVLVSITSDGTVTDVTNIEPILNATLKALNVKSDTVNPKALEYARLGIRTQIGLMVNQLFFTLAPDTAVSVGSTWARADSVPVNGLPASATVSITLKAIREADEGRRAELATTMKTNVAIPKKTIDDQYYTMKIDKVSLSGEGSWVVALTSGFPVTRSSTIRSNFVGTATMKAGPEKGKSQQVTASESTVMTVRRTAYTPAPSAGE